MFLTLAVNFILKKASIIDYGQSLQTGWSSQGAKHEILDFSISRKFQRNETRFCTVNNDNFRDITFEEVRYMDVEMSFKLKWSFLEETSFSITMQNALKR